MKLKYLLAFTRIPGNAFSYWIRQLLHWSKGPPVLENESKDSLFNYLNSVAEKTKAIQTASQCLSQFHLQSLFELSTTALYRKNIYLIDTLEKATEGLSLFAGNQNSISALDIGSQDWHYVFGLERWLRYHQGSEQRAHGAGSSQTNGREVKLTGIEVDGYGIYANFHSRRDYALAYAKQTENISVQYKVDDFLKYSDKELDVITLFYPFVTRHHLLLWGLPLQFFLPERIISHAAKITKKNSAFIVYCHTVKEHEIFVSLTKKSGAFMLLREGPVQSNLVDFYEAVEERRFSIWKKN